MISELYKKDLNRENNANLKIDPRILVREESFGLLIYDIGGDRFYFLDRENSENTNRFKKRKFIKERQQGIIDFLINLGIVSIIDGKVSIIESKEYDFEKVNFYLGKPCTVTWEITQKCNLDCCYCFSKNSTSVEILRYELIDQIIDNIKGAEVMRVIITGGEPLINLKRFFYILDKLSNTKIGIILSTNGTMIDDRLAIKISRYVSAVQISLDGKKDTHDKIKGRGTFEKTIKGIEYCIKNGIFTQVNLVPTKLNRDEIIEVVSLCEKLRVNRFQLFPLIPRGKGVKVYETLKIDKMKIERIYSACQRAKKRRGWNISIGLSRRHFTEGSCILIKPDGSVYSPSYDSDVSSYAGNLDNESLLSLWEESKVFNRKNHLIQSNPYMIIGSS
jgi:MoaA/NifB/PqqE/SkfB family radical SAM enzyme